MYLGIHLVVYHLCSPALSAWSIQGSHAPPHGPVIRELPGNFTGVICPVQFTDKNATAVCMSSGSSYTGNALGSESFSTGRSLSGFLQGREPVWFGLPRCAAENGSPPCKLDDTVARDCYGRTYAAGVLCADNGRLYGFMNGTFPVNILPVKFLFP